MNDLVERFFATPVPEELWHYTTMAGFEGIVRSGKIWATEVRHTTDGSEFVHAGEIALSYLDRFNPTTPVEKGAVELCVSLVKQEFETGFLSRERSEIFVASFSAAKDRKSQWIDFADRATGVSIAFDLRQVRPPKEYRLAATLAPCVYDRVTAERLFETAFARFFEVIQKQYANVENSGWAQEALRNWRIVDRACGLAFKREAFEVWYQHDLGEKLRSALREVVFDMLRLASHCKNSYYSEEREWRLALPHFKETALKYSSLQHRGPTNNIPYIAHELFQSERLPISQVMAGPRCVNLDSVAKCLAELGYRVPVTRSASPGRKTEDI